MRLICQNCKNKWDYRGNNPYYAYCSRCHHLVSIRKHRLDEQKLIFDDDEEPKRVRTIDNEDELTECEQGASKKSSMELTEGILSNQEEKHFLSKGECSCCKKLNDNLLDINNGKYCPECVILGRAFKPT